MTERHTEISHVSSGESFTSISTRKQQHTRRRTINFSSVTTRRAHARSRVRKREMEQNGTGRDTTNRKVQTGTDVTRVRSVLVPVKLHIFSPVWLHEAYTYGSRPGDVAQHTIATSYIFNDLKRNRQVRRRNEFKKL